MNILRGIRVIDVTAWAFVPSAGGIMAHWGADVIKVESPAHPDPMRTFGGTLESGGASTQFKHYSRGKRSIAIDLTTDEGRSLMYKLVASADVFLTSYLPETRRKLKIDVDDLKAFNPRLIYARGTGQGPKGPESERPGYDLISWWSRGSLSQSLMDVSGVPWPTTMVGHGDGMAGTTLAGGICAALLHRERTGEAPVVDGSLMGAAVWFNGPAIIGAQFGDSPREHRRETRPTGVLGPATSAIYQTSDHRFLILHFLGDSDLDFSDLCEHIGRSDLASDARFAKARERMAYRGELTAIFDEVFASRSLAAWKQALVSARGAWSWVQTPAEIHDDTQAIANGFVRNVDYPDGPLALPVPPILFDEEAGDPPKAPDFGEHTGQILAELGLDLADVAILRASGVVR